MTSKRAFYFFHSVIFTGVLLSALKLGAKPEYHFGEALVAYWSYDINSCKKGFSKHQSFYVKRGHGRVEIDAFLSLKAPSPNSQWMEGKIAWEYHVELALPLHIEAISIVSYDEEGFLEVLYEESFPRLIALFPGSEYRFEVSAPSTKPSTLKVNVWAGFGD